MDLLSLLKQRGVRRYLVIASQVVHFLIALAFVVLALVEFSETLPAFDLLGGHGGIPMGVFQVRRRHWVWCEAYEEGQNFSAITQAIISGLTVWEVHVCMVFVVTRAQELGYTIYVVALSLLLSLQNTSTANYMVSASSLSIQSCHTTCIIVIIGSSDTGFSVAIYHISLSFSELEASHGFSYPCPGPGKYKHTAC